MKNTVYKLVLALVMLTTISTVNASIIDISVDNVGAIKSIADDSPEASIGFLLGESLSLRFTFDDSTNLTLASATTITYDNAFFDSNAKLWLTGLTSGVTLEYFGGLIIEVDDKQEFEVEGLEVSATAEHTRILGGDIDWNTRGTDIFSDVTSLPIIFAELFASPFTNNSTNIASTRFWANGNSQLGMEFGHVPETSNFSQTTIAKIPEPTSLVILSLALLGLVSRKTFKN